jgi:hypothetical protein
MRGEFRYMMNADGEFEDKYRYRQMLKFVIPLNSHVFRKGVVYFVSTEELIFKAKAKTKGINFIDRNRVEAGFGYLFTDNIQLELAYLNEFMPRDDGNQIYNALELTLTFNNLFTNLKKSFFSKSTETVQD